MEKDKEFGWKEAIIEVLKQSKTPMHYQQIADNIYTQGLKTAQSATPANTVASVLSMSFKNDGADCPFVRTSLGYYTLKNAQNDAPELPDPSEATTSEVTGIVNAFGMFWDREKVLWGATAPALLGQQQLTSTPVNFANQKGVYLLHDSQGVLYVGRVTKQNLAERLNQHTTDRLAGRWTRFSWFGVFPVHENGNLKDDADFSNVDVDIVIATMEAVLIEAMEPRQNRKRGDDFKAIEYIQVLDPAIEEKQKIALLQKALTQLTPSVHTLH